MTENANVDYEQNSEDVQYTSSLEQSADEDVYYPPSSEQTADDYSINLSLISTPSATK